MNDAIRLELPLDEAAVRSLKAGDRVELTGVLWTGRDAAHRRWLEMLDRGEKLPIDLRGQTIYFVGPCPARPGMPIGSAGPTTSGRMDAYSPRVMRELGIRGMIGKGDRSDAVIEAIKACGGVYFAATGGAGALIARSIRRAEVVMFPDLGPEAVHRLEVEAFPAVVAIDAEGRDLYRSRA